MNSEHTSNGTPATNGNGSGELAWDKLRWITLVVGGIGLAAFIVLGLLRATVGDPGGFRQFFVSYLVGFVFWLSLPVGCMGLIGIQFVTGASWGVLLRRFFEAATRTLPLMAVLALPLALAVFMESASPYPWSKKPESLSHVATEVEELTHKFHDWCNAPGFVLRLAIYFAMWGTFIYFINKWSAKVEVDNDARARRLVDNISGPTIVLFALGNMFAVTDLVMSVELHFSSTMFPLIYSINQLLTCFTLCVAIFLTLAPMPPLKNVLRPKFQIDMGSFMLGLTMVWSYMNFSQYMLIWIGNLPEEIPYYLKRTGGGWEYVAYVLCIFHFALPFVLLLFRDVKLHQKRLRAVALGIFTMCALDVIWWIEPAYSHDGPPFYLLMDFAAIAGIGGIWGWMFLTQLRKHSLLPTHYIEQLPKAHHAH